MQTPEGVKVASTEVVTMNKRPRTEKEESLHKLHNHYTLVNRDGEKDEYTDSFVGLNDVIVKHDNERNGLFVDL